MFFDNVQFGPKDMFNDLKQAVDLDQSPQTVDLGIGVYRGENGQPYEMEVLRSAKKILAEANPSHEYQVTTGNAQLLADGAKVIFGGESAIVSSGRKLVSHGQLASVQTLSGSGAIHTGAMFLKHGGVAGLSNVVYVGRPTWGNYEPLLRLAGFEVRTYNYYDAAANAMDVAAMLAALQEAPRGSIVALQGCCHNPCAVDPTLAQWRAIAGAVRARGLVPLFDMAYQGLGRGIDEDAYAVRHFVDEAGVAELLVCQSFAKNCSLYGERVGAVHVVCATAEAARAVRDQLRCMVRWEFSSSPLYGSRLAEIMLSQLGDQWRSELTTMRERLQRNRNMLYRLLTDVYKTPGDWKFIIHGYGLFS
ncbi:hypothetical protein SEUCBS139899_010530 [Sporothrix eucalyptigena]